MQVEYEFTVAQPVETVRRLVADPDRAVACLPGLTIESAAPREYGGRLRFRVGSTTVTYRGTARVTSHLGEIATVELDGEEARGSGTAKGVVKLLLAGDDAGTAVTIEADMSVTGRLGNLDQAVLEDAVRRLFTRFGECVVAATSTDDEIDLETAPEAPREAPPEAATATTPEPVAEAEPAALTPAAGVAEPVEPADDDQLLAPEARRLVWPLKAMLPILAAVAAIGVLVEMIRRRRVR